MAYDRCSSAEKLGWARKRDDFSCLLFLPLNLPSAAQHLPIRRPTVPPAPDHTRYGLCVFGSRGPSIIIVIRPCPPRVRMPKIEITHSITLRVLCLSVCFPIRVIGIFSRFPEPFDYLQISFLPNRFYLQISFLILKKTVFFQLLQSIRRERCVRMIVAVLRPRQPADWSDKAGLYHNQ